MKRAIVAVLVVGCAAVAGAFWILEVVANRFFFPYRCTEEDKRVASSLVRLGVLDVRPDAAEPYGGRRGGCDDDDRLAYAEQDYRLPGSRAGVLPFYREAAGKGGWERVAGEEDAAGLCFRKSVQGRVVYLSVWVADGAPEKDGADYVVQVSSAPSGGSLC
ncbi:hypothetical protein [Nonomuraea sp. NPDC003754]